MPTRKKTTAPPEPPAKKPRKPRKKVEPIRSEDDMREEFGRMPGKDAVMHMTGFEPAPNATTPPEYLELGFTVTSTPGVYRNRAGILVDGDGVMIDHATLKNKDQERFERIIGGPVDTPAKFLKAVALDPQIPLNTRLTAATSAAPYFDRKKPIGIDGGEDGKAISIEVVHKIQGMSQEELDKLESLLARGAVALIEGADGVFAPEDQNAD